MAAVFIAEKEKGLQPNETPPIFRDVRRRKAIGRRENTIAGKKVPVGPHGVSTTVTVRTGTLADYGIGMAAVKEIPERSIKAAVVVAAKVKALVTEEIKEGVRLCVEGLVMVWGIVIGYEVVTRSRTKKT